MPFVNRCAGRSFGVSQTRVSRLTGSLLNVLNQTLAARGQLPVRGGAQLAQCLAAHLDKVFTYDGVERGIPRNADREGQQEAYRAKKGPCLEKQYLVR